MKASRFQKYRAFQECCYHGLVGLTCFVGGKRGIGQNYQEWRMDKLDEVQDPSHSSGFLSSTNRTTFVTSLLPTIW